MSEEPVTVKVHLTQKAYADLESSAYAEATNRTDVISRALQVYAAIGAAQPGEVVTITNHDGEEWKRVVIV